MDCDSCTKFRLDEEGFNCPNCSSKEDPFQWGKGFRFLYIIELDPSVKEINKFREMNPRMKTGKKCFYIGQTGRCPDTRFLQHKRGHKGNRYAKRYGSKLRRDIYKKFNPIKDQDESVKVEARVANIFRNLGYGVWYK